MAKNWTKSVYSPHPSFAMEAASLANLKERTGKTLEEWILVVQETGPSTPEERTEWLKSRHHFTTNYATWVAQRASGQGGVDDYDPEALVEAMFAGAKSGLKPVYDRLVTLGKALGPDVKVCPGKTIVPFYRQHVFAQAKPTTRTRIDLGLALGDTPARGRILDTGGFAKGDRITHRIPIPALEEIDDEVTGWLKRAYDRDSK